MKTVAGRVINSEPISLSTATKILSGFASSNNGASQDVSAYLRRASAAFTELKIIHREIKSSSAKKKNTESNARSPTGEFEQLSRAKGIDNLVEIRGKSGFRKSETVSEEKLNYVREQDEIKDDKKKSKKKKEEDDFDEKVKEKLEEKARDEERKEKKSKKKKKKKEDVFEKVEEKLEEESRDEERKEKKKKKKRKSDGEIGSEERERKSKKKRKSKENDS